MREPINDRAAAFRERLRKAEPVHVETALELAGRAWRRRLTDEERDGLRGFYDRLRKADVDHEAAIRLTLARILTSPKFLYRRERPGPGAEAVAVSDEELATRLSYFLWSSLPDGELRRVAADSRLAPDDAGGPDAAGGDESGGDESGGSTDELLRQTRRMLGDPRTRRLAIQFACQWLHLRNFDQNDEKNERLYPEFAALRGDMSEETIRFFEDMFRNNGSILDLLEADHTFLNEPLAKHYGIDGSACRRRWV